MTQAVLCKGTSRGTGSKVQSPSTVTLTQTEAKGSGLDRDSVDSYNKQKEKKNGQWEKIIVYFLSDQGAISTSTFQEQDSNTHKPWRLFGRLTV